MLLPVHSFRNVLVSPCVIYKELGPGGRNFNSLQHSVRGFAAGYGGLVPVYQIFADLAPRGEKVNGFSSRYEIEVQGFEVFGGGLIFEELSLWGNKNSGFFIQVVQRLKVFWFRYLWGGPPLGLQ